MIREISRGVTLALRDLRWLTLVLFLALADQLTKYWIVSTFELHEVLPVIPGFFNLVYVQNLGAAFGMFSELHSPVRELVLFVSTAVALGVVFGFLGGVIGERGLGRVALAMVCGGAIGNLIDRTRLGYVIDYLDFFVDGYHWPAFNLADSLICVGVAILVLLPRPVPESCSPSKAG